MIVFGRRRCVGWRRSPIYRGKAHRHGPRLSVGITISRIVRRHRTTSFVAAAFNSTSTRSPRGARFIVSTKLGSPDRAGSYKRLTRRRCSVVGGGSDRRSADCGFAALGKSVSTAGTIVSSPRQPRSAPDGRLRKRGVGWCRASIHRGEAHRIARGSPWASRSHRSFDATLRAAAGPRRRARASDPGVTSVTNDLAAFLAQSEGPA
jgi:hypothetical protein